LPEDSFVRAVINASEQRDRGITLDESECVWEGRDEQYVQVQNWTRTLSVIQKLKQALDTCDTPTCASEFETALGMLEAARR
jgi:hypothetical protein